MGNKGWEATQRLATVGSCYHHKGLRDKEKIVCLAHSKDQGLRRRATLGRYRCRKHSYFQRNGIMVGGKEVRNSQRK